MLFVSSNYVKKKWTKHELKSAQTRSFEDDEEYILSMYIEDVAVPGLNRTIGYLDINEFSEEQIVELLRKNYITVLIKMAFIQHYVTLCLIL